MAVDPGYPDTAVPCSPGQRSMSTDVGRAWLPFYVAACLYLCTVNLCAPRCSSVDAGYDFTSFILPAGRRYHRLKCAGKSLLA